MTGLGGIADKSSSIGVNWEHPSLEDLKTMYKLTWAGSKGVDIPIDDALHGWRTLDGKPLDADIKLSVVSVLKKALVYHRSLGGAAIYFHTGVDANNMQTELGRSEKIERLVALSPINLAVYNAQLIEDLSSPWYGMPEYFTNQTRSGVMNRIHISRLWIFPQHQAFRSDKNFWQPSILAKAASDVKGAGAALQIIDHTLQRLNIDTYTIPDLMQMCSNSGQMKNLIERFALNEQMKSTFNSQLLDKEESYDSAHANVAGVEKLVQTRLESVASAFDIPLTRFLGSSPAGLNSTGKSDLANYYANVESFKHQIIKPFLLFLDNRTGVNSDDWMFNNRRPVDPQEQSSLESSYIQSAKSLNEMVDYETALRYLTSKIDLRMNKEEISTLIKERKQQ